MSQRLTKRVVDEAAPRECDHLVWDSEIKGFGLKVTSRGQKIFLLQYRYPRGRAGRVRRFTIGAHGSVTVEQARRIAEAKRGDVARGIDPMAELQKERQAVAAERSKPKRSVEHIVREFVERYARRRNRSWKETERILKRHILPAWGKRQITSITRADVNHLLDEIEDSSGAPMATAVLAQTRKLFNWFAIRDDRFYSPIVQGMARTNPKAMRRDRVLSDTEIEVLWQALEKSLPPFRQLIRFLLLTGQRREEAAKAAKSEFDGDLWTIPAARAKNGQPNIVPLSPAAIAQIEDLGHLRELGEFVFTTCGPAPFSGFSKAKKRLDAEMERLLRERSHSAAIPDTERLLRPWRIHDLRRTAKTLMQRCGVRPDISERVLNHVIGGVESVYDHHNYVPEKCSALNALAEEIERIVRREPGSNVVRLAIARG